VSAVASRSIRTVAFGDLEAGVWGVAWSNGEAFAALGPLRSDASVSGAIVTVAGSEPDEEWTLTAPDFELRVTPHSEPVVSSEIDGFDQLCRVHGPAVVGGEHRALDLPGRRGSHHPALEPGELESIRDVSAWFGESGGVALTALRPSGVKGHDRDVIAASVFDADGAVGVADPRLSTTYAGAGSPLRVGLELWIDQEESEQQYPRRAAGEAVGAHADWSVGSFLVEAHPLRCRSRGAEGAGVYLLARRR
jgi:hypothetical protein